MEINLGEMLAIDAAVRARARRLEAVSDQHQWLPRRADRALIGTCRGAKHEALRAKLRAWKTRLEQV